MNQIKTQQKVPDIFNHTNITTIYKGKGPKNEMDSDRGVFNVTIFRHILDRLIYNDEYEKVDQNMTDSNVGARKKRNIRDNIYVLNAVMNSVLKKEMGCVDLQIYDVSQSFGSLWLQEGCMSYMNWVLTMITWFYYMKKIKRIL